MKAKIAPNKDALTSKKASLDTHKFVLLNADGLKKALEDYFSRTNNQNTNQTYANGLGCFFDYCLDVKLNDILDIEPSHIAGFTAHMTTAEYGVATTRLYLSAIRMFFDHCVVEGLMAVNPAKAVKLPKSYTGTGKTPVITPEQVRQILNAIPLKQQIDYRDRALIGLMVFSFFRISAAVSLRVKDYELRGEQRWLIGEEKGSKRHEMPVHASLEHLIDDYLTECDLFKQPQAFLFQSSNARGGRLTGKAYGRTAAWKMVRRRASLAGVHRDIGNHSFRATGITTYLNSGGSLEDARIMANHSNATTTKLYDRTGDRVKIREVNRIDI